MSASGPQGPPRLGYRPEIDGLRAVAVLPVILFHAGFEWFSGGYVGVDVFFVISGYLITSILLADLGAGRFSILRFYERRARRILPALFAVLACTSIAGWLWMVPAQFEEYSRALVAVVLFLSNLHFWRTQDYFAPRAELNPLLHTWSLAVEEQFYLGFPLLLLAIWLLARRRLLATIAVLSLASLLLAEWGWRNEPGANFFLLPTRAWELGAGAICAIILRDTRPRASTLLPLLGLGLIVFSVVAFDEETPFPSLYALAPVGGTALVILHAGAGSPAARLLSLRPVIWVGLISYSAYLWHQPLFALARIRSLTHPSPHLMLALSLAALALAYLTWHFVEQPFRRRAAPVLPTRRAVFAASVAATALFLGLGVYGQLSEGRMRAWTAMNGDRAAVYEMYAEAERIAGVYLDDGACRFNVPNLDPPTIERLRDCRELHGPGVAVLGDSHAVDLFNGLQALAGDFVFGMTYASCWFDTTPRNCDFAAFESLLRDEPGLFEQVLYHQAGYRLFRTPRNLTGREAIQQMPEYAVLPAFPVLEGRIDAGLVYLARLSELANVVWVGPRIEPHIGLNYMLNGGCEHRYWLRPGQRAMFADLDRRIAAAAADAGVAYVSLVDATRFDMATDFMTCDALYWRDGDHWSIEGARRFVGRLLAEGLPASRAEAGNDPPLLR